MTHYLNLNGVGQVKAYIQSKCKTPELWSKISRWADGIEHKFDKQMDQIQELTAYRHHMTASPAQVIRASDGEPMLGQILTVSVELRNGEVSLNSLEESCFLFNQRGGKDGPVHITQMYETNEYKDVQYIPSPGKLS